MQVQIAAAMSARILRKVIDRVKKITSKIEHFQPVSEKVLTGDLAVRDLFFHYRVHQTGLSKHLHGHAVYDQGDGHAQNPVQGPEQCGACTTCVVR